jgi:2-polyprenyl-3-methyl-5-hydroxy-6-metoxy-1,4-benzoquinol methylase
LRNAEVDRIRAAYRGYDETETERHKRLPTNAGNRMMAAELDRAVGRWLMRSGLDLGVARILDAGCGRGEFALRLTTLGAKPENIVGIDLLPDRIQAATVACPGARFICGDIAELDLSPGSFDLIACVTLFGSVLDIDDARSVAKRLTVLLKPEGVVLWCDSRYPNPTNSQVRGWTKSEIAGLFPGYGLELEAMTLLPPLARRLGPLTRWAYPLLSLVPPLRARLGGYLTNRSAPSETGSR